MPLHPVVRGVAKAAPHLAMSQSAVSEAIASLEDALRVRLLDRSPQGIEPTIYAQALLKRGNVVFDELKQGGFVIVIRHGRTNESPSCLLRVKERTRSRGKALRAGRSKWRGWR